MTRIKGRSARVITLSLLLGLSLVGLSLMLARPRVVKAGTLTVTSTADTGAGRLAESLLKAEAGAAIAVWGSSGMTLPDGQAALNREFYRWIFGSGRAGPMTLGDAILRAKAAASDTDIRRTWVLLGDPTMRLR